jgi:HK97 family phage prohead protease
MQIEKRGFEARVSAAGRRLTGLAAPYGIETRIGSFTEVINQGAFSHALTGDILALADHDPSKVLARTKSGTLKLSEGGDGLRFDLELPDTQLGKDTLVLAQRGDLGGMSFGFTIPKGGERWNGDKRELLKIDLHEISVVSAWPAYSGTSIQARGKQANGLHYYRLRLLELGNGV